MAAHFSSGRVSSLTTGPHRAGGEDVAGDRVGLGRLDGVGAELLDRPGHVVDVDVGHGEPGPGLVEQVAQVGADLADALDHDVAAGQVVLVPELLGHRLHALQDPVGGVDRGVAAAAVGRRAAGDEPGLQRDGVHVGDVGPDVLGGDVAAAEALDEAAVGAQQGLGLDPLGVAEDDRLAPAEVEPGHGRLVAHALGQPEDVGERVVLGGVGVEAGAAQGRAEGGRVDGDDGLEAGGGIVVVDDLLVLATHEPERSQG